MVRSPFPHNSINGLVHPAPPDCHRIATVPFSLSRARNVLLVWLDDPTVDWIASRTADTDDDGGVDPDADGGERGEPDADGEPSLGSAATGERQTQEHRADYASGWGDDLEVARRPRTLGRIVMQRARLAVLARARLSSNDRVAWDRLQLPTR